MTEETGTTDAIREARIDECVHDALDSCPAGKNRSIEELQRSLASLDPPIYATPNQVVCSIKRNPGAGDECPRPESAPPASDEETPPADDDPAPAETPANAGAADAAMGTD